ncbi:hypothetical protein [Medusavirus stheno T3]|uniref:Uncharacterized protein n=1 Tax=Medusavirus stheno T3 TaxID=3069717 RepID=A0A7S7YEY2_9VIRU|nr:hypothetical protein QKU73_gp223 [Acanthamoeba castellanii medusavirus]QPB44552.1 hypothetical protein [Medusavirus stheno T3]
MEHTNDGGCDCGKSDACATCQTTVCKHTASAELDIILCDCCHYLSCTSEPCLEAIRDGKVGRRCCRALDGPFPIHG